MTNAMIRMSGVLAAGLLSAGLSMNAVAQCGGAAKVASADKSECGDKMAGCATACDGSKTMIAADDVAGSVAAAAMTASTSMDAMTGAQDIVDTAVAAGSFKTLVAALQAAGLADALRADGPFTVFAPTDEAFAKLPKGTVDTLLKPENKSKLQAILLYHVVPNAELNGSTVVRKKGAGTLNGQTVKFKVQNGVVMINNAKVITPNVDASNGVIHVIDTVILPTEDTIATVAKNAGTFNTLLAAAKAAGLVDALTGKQALTVFAPTDEAFAKLPAGTVENLLKPENKDQLVAVLKYHIVAGRVYSKDAAAAGLAKTLQGGEVVIEIVDGQLRVDGAKVVATDIDAANGVVHVIDSVILPMEG